MYLARLGRLPEAFVAVQRAQELDVLSLMINANLASLWYYARQWCQAAEQAARTLEINPTFWYARALVGMVCEQQGRWDEAIAEYQQVLDVTKEPWRAWLLARGYALAGRHGEAREVLARLQQLARDSFLSPTLLAAVHVPLGQTDQALACLEKAVQERDSYLIYLKVDPKYDPLREDPRFADVLRRIGLA